MKLRQATKIIKRIHLCAHNAQCYGTPLPKSWRRYMSMWHQANAVYNHHAFPFGRQANRWANDHVAKMCKASKVSKLQGQQS